MKNTFKDLTGKILRPSTTFLVCITIIFLAVFSFGDGKFFNTAKILHLFGIFYDSQLFAYIGLFSIIVLIARVVEAGGLTIKSTEWFENKKRLAKGWPTKEEEVILESLFYIGINFDELYKFVHWAYDSNYVAFTENSQATVQNYTLLVRNDADKYWLSYFRFSHREPARIRMLYLIISNFMEVLTGDKEYTNELKDQARHDPELKNVDTEKLLIAIINKQDVKRYLDLCEKYYKMIIDKRVENKNALQ